MISFRRIPGRHHCLFCALFWAEEEGVDIFSGELCGHAGWQLRQEKVKSLRIEEFVMVVQEEVAAKLGEQYEVSTQMVRKNNNVQFHGLLVQEKGRSISPTIYLDLFHKAYEEGENLEEIIQFVIKVIREDTPEEQPDMSFFQNYEMVKNKICYRLISEERNRDIVDMIPNIPYLDLLIVFYYPYEDREMGQGSILIRNSHMEQWGVNVQELWERAKRNTPALYPAECCPMESILMEMMGMDIQEELKKKVIEDYQMVPRIPMLVIGNQQRVFGAAVMIYEGFLERIAAQMDGGYYILPSSIHELIVIPATGAEEAMQIKKMIREVNETQVEEQDILSESLYYYDRGRKKVRIIC